MQLRWLRQFLRLVHVSHDCHGLLITANAARNGSGALPIQYHPRPQLQLHQFR